MSDLLKKQQLFATNLLPNLLLKVRDLGLQVTMGETWRTDEQAVLNSMTTEARAHLADAASDLGFAAFAIALRAQPGGRGILLSVHRNRLAVDLNFFRDGIYITDPVIWAELGDWWEKQDPDARWGGRFGDPGHFSLEWMGRK